MVGSYLLIIHDRSGINVLIMDETGRKKRVKSSCRILFKDLPPPPEMSGFAEAALFNAAMDTAAEKMDFQSCADAVVLTSPALVHFRMLPLPFRSEKKIQQVFPFELEPLLPISNETYISDFHLLDRQGEESIILTASISVSWVETYFQKLESYGIKPKIISPSGYAGAVAFLRAHPQITDFIFFHITEEIISIVLIYNRKPWIVRTLPGSFRSAETLAACLRQTITGFSQKTGEDTFFDLVIGLDQDIQDKDGFFEALQTARPSLGTEIQGDQKFHAVDINELLMTVTPDHTGDGLVNFCKGKYSSASFLKTHFYSIAAGIVLFFCMIVAGLISTGIDNSNLYKKISFIDQKALSVFMETFPDQKRVQDPYLQMKATVKEILKKTGADSDMNATADKGVRVIDILTEISVKIDPAIDVEISSFLLNAGRLGLSGSTDNFNSVDKIKTGLESSALFKKVDISSAAADKKGDRVNFKFNIDL